MKNKYSKAVFESKQHLNNKYLENLFSMLYVKMYTVIVPYDVSVCK